MTTLPPANGRPQTLSFNKTREVQVGPRFEIQSTESSPPNWEPSSLNAQPAFTNQPEPEKPAPAKKRRRYNAFRDRRARVRDFRKMLPRKVPRRRDLDIYQTVVHDKLSQHLVAEIYGLSQTRISQIVREVRAWKATLPYEIPGMTEQQQINLATHETIEWLSRIRDKCMELADVTTGHDSKSYIKEGQGTTHRTLSQRSIPPKPAFLATAMAAVLQIGKLAGAGEQWIRGRRGSGESDEEFKVQSSGFEVDEQHPLPSPQPTAVDGETLIVERQTLNSSSNGRFSNKKPPKFTPKNGKCNGHETSALPRPAQVERLRREKRWETAYQAFALCEGVKTESQPHFFRLLRELDGIADRVEEQVEQVLRRERSSSTSPKHPASLPSEREHCLEKLLKFQLDILTPPYDDGWVFEHYNVQTGRFRWWEVDGKADEQ